MEMLKRPLQLTAEENARQLRDAEEREREYVAKNGDPSGNRHERRKAAKMERLSQ
jgi:hypothetical protein